MKESNFVFESADSLNYYLYRISIKTGKSYSWIKNKIATKNPKNKDNECFKYEVTITLRLTWSL